MCSQRGKLPFPPFDFPLPPAHPARARKWRHMRKVARYHGVLPEFLPTLCMTIGAEFFRFAAPVLPYFPCAPPLFQERAQQPLLPEKPEPGRRASACCCWAARCASLCSALHLGHFCRCCGGWKPPAARSPALAQQQVRAFFVCAVCFCIGVYIYQYSSAGNMQQPCHSCLFVRAAAAAAAVPEYVPGAATLYNNGHPRLRFLAHFTAVLALLSCFFLHH